MPAEITCADCGNTVTMRADAQRCNPCAALRQIEHARRQYKRAKKCRTCSAKFRPMKKQDLSYCGKCSARQHSKTVRPDAECALCKGPIHKQSVLKSVCLCCIKDPERQDMIIRMLVKQQAARKAATAPPDRATVSP